MQERLMIYFLNQDNIDGQTGPIAGNDIAVYHVNTDFKLGKEVLVKVDNDPISLPILDSSEPYIWPACLPKEDDDQYFEQSDHPRKHKNRVNAMLAEFHEFSIAFKFLFILDFS